MKSCTWLNFLIVLLICSIFTSVARILLHRLNKGLRPNSRKALEVEFGLAARPCETRRETRPRDRGLVSQAWSREKLFETYF